MFSISVRPLIKEDLPLLQNIGKVTFSETFDEINTPDNMKKYLKEKFNQKLLISELEDSDSKFFFAEVKDKVVGYLKVNKDKAQTEDVLNNAMEIERIYVLKNYHGKNVGRVLFDKALEIAQEMNASVIWLGVWESNYRAIKFYEKYGFEKFDTHIFRIGNNIQTDYLMKLDIK